MVMLYHYFSIYSIYIRVSRMQQHIILGVIVGGTYITPECGRERYIVRYCMDSNTCKRDSIHASRGSVADLKAITS
jgi:hypothetical protein